MLTVIVATIAGAVCATSVTLCKAFAVHLQTLCFRTLALWSWILW